MSQDCIDCWPFVLLQFAATLLLRLFMILLFLSTMSFVLCKQAGYFIIVLLNIFRYSMCYFFRKH